MNAEIDSWVWSGTENTLGALSYFFGRKNRQVYGWNEGVFDDYAYQRSWRVLREVISYAGSRRDVLDPKGPPLV